MSFPAVSIVLLYSYVGRVMGVSFVGSKFGPCCTIVNGFYKISYASVACYMYEGTQW